MLGNFHEAVDEGRNRLHVINVSQNDPSISHLMYADDFLVIYRVDIKEAKVIQRSFDRYCRWSTTKKHILDVFGFKELGPASIYLGNSFVMGRNTSKEFARVTEKVHKRFYGVESLAFLKIGKGNALKVSNANYSSLLYIHL